MEPQGLKCRSQGAQTPAECIHAGCDANMYGVVLKGAMLNMPATVKGDQSGGQILTLASKHQHDSHIETPSQTFSVSSFFSNFLSLSHSFPSGWFLFLCFSCSLCVSASAVPTASHFTLYCVNLLDQVVRWYSRLASICRDQNMILNTELPWHVFVQCKTGN